MGFIDLLKRAFANRSPETDGGIYFYVRCERCDERVQVRLNPQSDLQQQFEPSGDGIAGYFVRKVVIDQGCFRPIEVSMTFDPARRELSRDIAGGKFITQDEFLAGRASP